MTDLTTPQSAARILNRYARGYSAGAFATPTASDMGKIMTAGGWHEHDGVAYTSAWMKRESRRRDWTGRMYTILAGTQVITHMAAHGDVVLPRLDGYGRIYTYIEDANLTRQLRAQGREVCAVRISAASEIIACWGRSGSYHRYPAVDRATVTRVVDPAGDIEAAAHEAAALTGWLDDFPFYSDGSWSALSLRGFRRDDPTWGIKPAEMSKTWKAANPEALGYTCGWTVLAERCQGIVNVVNATFSGFNSQLGNCRLERVRLLKMDAPAPGKVSRLARHTDITDRSAGTADGQIMRFHIPLVSHKDSRMSAWNLGGERISAHLHPGTMWYLDARKPHAVEHHGPIDRIHLVVDVIADAGTRLAVERGWEASTEAARR